MYRVTHTIITALPLNQTSKPHGSNNYRTELTHEFSEAAAVGPHIERLKTEASVVEISINGCLLAQRVFAGCRWYELDNNWK